MGVGGFGDIGAMAPDHAVVCGPGASDQPPIFVKIDTTSGDTQIGPNASATKKVRLLSCKLFIAAGVAGLQFQSGAAGTALEGAQTVPTNYQLVLPWNPHGWFESAVNAILNLHQGGVVQISGHATVQQVDGTTD